MIKVGMYILTQFIFIGTKTLTIIIVWCFKIHITKLLSNAIWYNKKEWQKRKQQIIYTNSSGLLSFLHRENFMMREILIVL